MQYQRIFVTLQQDRQDYSIDGRKAMGRCVIETRGSAGKLSIYVQGLKPEVIYKLYLIATEGDTSRGLPVAIVPVDAKGKGELRFEFNAENVGGSSMGVSDFSAVAIIVPSEKGVLPVLTGFMEDEISWENNFVDITKETRREVLAAEKTAEPEIEAESSDATNVQEEHTEHEHIEQVEVEVEVEVVVVVEAESVIEIEEDKTALLYKQEQAEPEENIIEKPVEESNINFWEVEATNQPSKDETKVATHDEVSKQIHKEIKVRNMNEDFKKLIDEYGSYMTNLGKKPFEGLEPIVASEIHMHVDELEQIFHNHMKMNPFPNDHLKIKWARITHKDLVLLGEKGYYTINHPLVLLGYRKYKHLILGKCATEGKSKYILGVPDCYSIEYKESALIAGFMEFKYCEKDSAYDGDYGYWLKDM